MLLQLALHLQLALSFILPAASNPASKSPLVAGHDTDGVYEGAKVVLVEPACPDGSCCQWDLGRAGFRYWLDSLMGCGVDIGWVFLDVEEGHTGTGCDPGERWCCSVDRYQMIITNADGRREDVWITYKWADMGIGYGLQVIDAMLINGRCLNSTVPREQREYIGGLGGCGLRVHTNCKWKNDPRH